jgi:hypothetical protein
MRKSDRFQDGQVWSLQSLVKYPSIGPNPPTYVILLRLGFDFRVVGR